MPLSCQSPECEREFHHSVGFDVVEAKEEGETPYFTHVHEAEGGFGVATEYLCSAECMAEYLEEVA